LETNIMKIRTVWCALMLGGLMIVAAPATPSLAQHGHPGVSASKHSAAPASKKATRHARPHRTKHRYWRHRGGSHPHYGSRRIRH
jgi:hypothetical protein